MAVSPILDEGYKDSRRRKKPMSRKYGKRQSTVKIDPNPSVRYRPQHEDISDSEEVCKI